MARKRRVKRKAARRVTAGVDGGWVVPLSNILLCLNVLLLAAVLHELH